MTPFFFGPPSRRLYGVFHPAEREMADAVPVLLCNPYGHEAVRMHRFYRLLATRLARTGVPVLRFDYHATGDSPGDDEAGEMQEWALDVVHAHQELLRRAGTERARWFASRLGGTIALRAAGLHAVRPTEILVWEPLIDGAEYIRELRQRHLEMLDVSYFIPDPVWHQTFGNNQAGAALPEALGFGIGHTLLAQWRQLAPDTVHIPDTSVVVLARSDDRALRDWAALRAHGGAGLTVQTLEHAVIWTTNPHPDNELVPMAALQQVAAQLQQHTIITETHP